MSREIIRVGVLADFHGDHKREALEYFLAQTQPDQLLCVGDVQDYEPYPVPLTFIRGNHEDWDLLAQLANGQLTVPNLYYLTDDERLTIGDLSVIGIGGNWSPTGKLAPKYIRPDYLARLRTQHADIVLSHETPLYFANGERERTLEPLRELCKLLRPRLWFSGHHHWYETETLGRTEIISLGKWPHEWVVLEIERSTVNWEQWSPLDPTDYYSRLPAWQAAEEVQKRELLALERQNKRR